VRSRGLARETQALAILLERHHPILDIVRGMANDLIKMPKMLPNVLTSVLVRDRIRDGVEGGPQSTHDLERADAVLTDLVEGERQIVFPRWHRNYQTKDAIGVPGIASIQVAWPKPVQQILYLVDCLHRGGWIVDGR
jgi:hypothetical protein